MRRIGVLLLSSVLLVACGEDSEPESGPSIDSADEVDEQGTAEVGEAPGAAQAASACVDNPQACLNKAAD